MVEPAGAVSKRKAQERLVWLGRHSRYPWGRVCRGGMPTAGGSLGPCFLILKIREASPQGLGTLAVWCVPEKKPRTQQEIHKREGGVCTGDYSSAKGEGHGMSWSQQSRALMLEAPAEPTRLVQCSILEHTLGT